MKKVVLNNIITSVMLLHEEGIVHRDIKPENIIVKKDLSVVLIDFGTAKTLNEDKHKKFIN